MVGEPSHMKQLSLNHMCKIGLTSTAQTQCGHASRNSRDMTLQLVVVVWMGVGMRINDDDYISFYMWVVQQTDPKKFPNIFSNFSLKYFWQKNVKCFNFSLQGEGEGRMSLMEQYFLHYIVILSRSEEGEVLLDYVIPFNGCHFS